MPAKKTQRAGAGRAYALGFEVACAVAGFVVIGFWIDRHYSSGPWGTLICLMLGLVGAFYNLIRQTSRLSGRAPAPPELPPGVAPPAERPGDDPHR